MERLRVGDRVKVISGKDKGKEGKIVKILRDEGRVIVEGVKMVKRHTRPRTVGETGQIVEKESPIHESNVMPIDPTTGKPTRVKVKVVEGKKVRVAKSGAVITPEK